MMSMLANQSTKTKITQKINAMVDIPFIGEEMEASIISMGVQQCLNIIVGAGGDGDDSRDVIPDADADEETTNNAKEAMVAKLNGHLDIPLLGEEQEAKLIRSVVDGLFALRGEDVEAE